MNAVFEAAVFGWNACLFLGTNLAAAGISQAISSLAHEALEIKHESLPDKLVYLADRCARHQPVHLEELCTASLLIQLTTTLVITAVSCYFGFPLMMTPITGVVQLGLVFRSWFHTMLLTLALAFIVCENPAEVDIDLLARSLSLLLVFGLMDPDIASVMHLTVYAFYIACSSLLGDHYTGDFQGFLDVFSTIRELFQDPEDFMNRHSSYFQTTPPCSKSSPPQVNTPPPICPPIDSSLPIEQQITLLDIDHYSFIRDLTSIIQKIESAQNHEKQTRAITLAKKLCKMDQQKMGNLKYSLKDNLKTLLSIICSCSKQELDTNLSALYRRWALQNHSDRGGDQEVFQSVTGLKNLLLQDAL